MLVPIPTCPPKYWVPVPFAVRLPPIVVLPVMPTVEDKVVAPDTPRVLSKLAAPVRFRVDPRVVAPVTPRLDPMVVAPVMLVVPAISRVWLGLVVPIPICVPLS